jgi:bifunctional non-homologous end joining protein LigD
MSDQRELTIENHRIVVSNPDKVLYPDDGLTKSDLVDHYRRVADVMLPHLYGRPLTLRRFPDGIEAEGFFQKEASDFFPDWIEIAKVPRRDGGAPVHHAVCDSAASLVYLASLATIEFHIWPSTVTALDNPDRMIVDIDPPDGVDTAELRPVARQIRRGVERLGLTAYVQATGGRGFHVVTPLDGSTDYDEVRRLARDLTDRIAAAGPDRLTTAIRKESRHGRIFLDTNRNGYGQTFVSPYSLRARPGAAVATPLDWRELGKATPNGYDIRRIGRRLSQRADPWRRIDEDALAAPVDLGSNGPGST